MTTTPTIEELTRWDIICFDRPEDGRSLGYDDPANVGLYHVQHDGEWESSHDTLDEAVEWLSGRLGVAVRSHRSYGYGSEERWLVGTADMQVGLYDYRTGEYLRPATADELRRSVEAADRDGGRGVIEVDGRTVYVEG